MQLKGPVVVFCDVMFATRQKSDTAQNACETLPLLLLWRLYTLLDYAAGFDYR
jgi:hypothetical protein